MRMNRMNAVIKQRPAVRCINMVLNCAFVAVRWKWLDYSINMIVFTPRSSLALSFCIRMTENQTRPIFFWIGLCFLFLSLLDIRVRSRRFQYRTFVRVNNLCHRHSYSQSYRVIRYFSFLVELLCCRLCARVYRRSSQPFCTFCYAPVSSCYWLTDWVNEWLQSIMFSFFSCSCAACVISFAFMIAINHLLVLHYASRQCVRNTLQVYLLSATQFFLLRNPLCCNVGRTNALWVGYEFDVVSRY